MSMTPKQAAVLGFIIERLEQTSVCPSYQEIADGLSLSSKSRVSQAIGQLEERGYIRRPGCGRRRALEVLRRPGQEALIPGEELLRMAHEMLSGALRMGEREDAVDLRVDRALYETLWRELEDRQCTGE